MDNVLLVSYHVSQWSIKRTDKSISKEIADKVGEDRDKVGRYVKNLINPKCPEYKAICRARDLGRKIHYAYTLPWQDGVRLLNANALDSYESKMNQAKDLFDQAVSEFIECYPELKNEAAYTLEYGSTNYFCNTEYPRQEALISHFGMRWEVTPIPSGGQFDQVAEMIGEAQAKRLAARMVSDQQDKWAEATKSVWKRLYEVLKHTANQLRNGKRIHNSVIDNLAELTDLLPVLNVSNDPELDKRRRELQAVLRQFSPESIKDKGNRNSCAGQVEDILKRVEELGL